MNPQSPGGVPPRDATSSSLDRRFYLAAWRWHFYAGLFVVPFFLILAVTGMTMMYIAAVDGRDGEKLAIEAPAGLAPQSLSRQVAAALTAVPGGTPVELIRASGPDRPNVFHIEAPSGEQIMAAVNPYTAVVVETWKRRDGWYDLADAIHSELLLGTTGDRLLEVAAGFGVVLIISGLYLWWPRQGGLRATLVPRLNGRGRAFWKQLHVTAGVYVSAFLLLFLLTGMAWTGVWGEKLVQAWNTFPAEKWDNVPLSDQTHAAMNHGGPKHVPWALEKTPMPASGSMVGREGTVPGAPVDLDAIDRLGRSIGFEGRYRIAFPGSATAVWTINQDTMSGDAESPFADRTVHIDRYSGKVLASVSFDDYSLAGQAMAVGTPLHMGLTGVWNIVLNTVICSCVIGMCLTGIAMWWLRRPRNAGFRLHSPTVPDGLPHWRSAMLVMLGVSLAFPLVGLTLVAVLALDLLIVSRVPAFRRVLA